MTILVTGSRSLTDQLLIDQACDTFILEAGKRGLSGFSCLKHGAAGGVDTLAANWAKRHGVEPVTFPAKWHIYGKSAGFKRNQEMIDSGFDVLLAIRCLGKSQGTDDMINRVKKTRKPIFLYREDGVNEWVLTK